MTEQSRVPASGWAPPADRYAEIPFSSMPPADRSDGSTAMPPADREPPGQEQPWPAADREPPGQTNPFPEADRDPLAVGAAVGAADQPPGAPLYRLQAEPPPELTADRPYPRPRGDWTTWSEVGVDLERELAEQQMELDRYETQGREQVARRQLGLRQAELKEYQAARAALIGHYGAERLAEHRAVDLAQEEAKAFLWSHNIVATENNVLRRNLARTEQDSSNPYTSYRKNADDVVTFAMPTSGDSGTLEDSFKNLVPERAMQTRVGWLVDPRTNLVSEIHEDLPPPAQGDWSTPEQLRDADNQNRQLVRLQGGYDANRPPPPRREWEQESPVPEPPLSDASWALQRREREYELIATDIANNRGQMFEQSEIDRYPDGFVGYQNQRPYSDLIPPQPATLRGFPGSGYGVSQRPVEPADLSDFVPVGLGAAAIVGTQSAVTEGDRTEAIDRALPVPTGLQEPAYPSVIAEPLNPERPAMPGPRAVESQYKVGAPLARPIESVAPERVTVVPVSRPDGLAAVPGSETAQRVAVTELPRCADAKVSTQARGATGPTVAAVPGSADESRRACTVAPMHLPRAAAAKVPAQSAPGLNEQPRTSGGYDAVRRTDRADGAAHVARGPIVEGVRAEPHRTDGHAGGPARQAGSGAFPDAGLAPTGFQAWGLGPEMVDRETWAAASGAAVGLGNATLYDGGKVDGLHELPRATDARVGRVGRTAAEQSVGIVEGERGDPRRNDTGVGPVGRPQSEVPAPTTVAPSDQQGGHNREHQAWVGGARTEELARGALVNPYAENVRVKSGEELVGHERVSQTHARDRRRQDARMTPSRARRPERPVSRRHDRPDRMVELAQ